MSQATMLSTSRKNTAAIETMISTMSMEMPVSLRVGQVIFEVSRRTWRTNSAGVVLAMVFFKCLVVFVAGGSRRQGGSFSLYWLGGQAVIRGSDKW